MNNIKHIQTCLAYYGCALSEKEIRKVSLMLFSLIVESCNGDYGVSPDKLKEIFNNIIGDEVAFTNFIIEDRYDIDEIVRFW